MKVDVRAFHDWLAAKYSLPFNLVFTTINPCCVLGEHDFLIPGKPEYHVHEWSAYYFRNGTKPNPTVFVNINKPETLKLIAHGFIHLDEGRAGIFPDPRKEPEYTQHDNEVDEKAKRIVKEYVEGLKV
jgi:hypothetical protein